MIGSVFQKEMLSQRFAACTVLAVVLIIANGLLSTQTYVHKKARYLTQRAIEDSKLHEITYYSALGSDWFSTPNETTPKAAPRVVLFTFCSPVKGSVLVHDATRAPASNVAIIWAFMEYPPSQLPIIQIANKYGN